ncbi:DUF3147 family protein [Akkermansiaceae bacterium]|nr:DUF3147 family protein [Akkermansiaceae bacterium]
MKILFTAVVILMVTKIQLLSDKLSALLIALPLTSFLAMIWMYHEKKAGDLTARTEGIAGHAWYTFWFVLPTMPMFLILPAMLRKGWSFYPALGMNVLITTALFWAMVFVMKKWFGIELM